MISSPLLPNCIHRRSTDRRPFILPTVLAYLVALSAAMLLLGCYETLPTENADDEATAMELTLNVGDKVVVSPGRRLQLEATPIDSLGQPVTGYEITWSSSDTSIVTAEHDGTLTALAVGAATVTASAKKRPVGNGGVIGGEGNAPDQLNRRVAVHVDPAAVASVEVQPDPIQMSIGEYQQMTAILRDAAGNVLSDRVVEWSTVNNSIAAVDETGEVFGKSVGTTAVTATSEGVSGSATLEVQETIVSVVDVAVWPTDVTIDAGRQAQFYAAMLHSDGSVACTPGSPSTDPNVLFNATVVAGCDSAAAMLDFSKVASSSAATVSW